MISLGIGELLVAYVGVLVVGLLFIWLAGNFLRALSHRRRRRHCVQCMFCGTTYEDTSKESLPACSSCAKANERIRPPFV